MLFFRIFSGDLPKPEIQQLIPLLAELQIREVPWPKFLYECSMHINVGQRLFSKRCKLLLLMWAHGLKKTELYYDLLQCISNGFALGGNASFGPLASVILHNDIIFENSNDEYNHLRRQQEESLLFNSLFINRMTVMDQIEQAADQSVAKEFDEPLSA
jgi:hypothetical protein